MMGRLYIKTSFEAGKTIIKDCYFTAPFKITKPFYMGEFAEIMIMQASAGILEGDSHEINIEIGKGSRVIITGQSYTKIFKSESIGSRQNITINIEDNAYLKYMPCPVIPFKDSSYEGFAKISLAETSKLVFRDVFAGGRIGMGEKFLFKKYHSRTIVYENNVPVFYDNTRLVPKETKLDGIGFFEGYTHMGTAYFYGIDKINTDTEETDSVLRASSSAKKGWVLRLLAHSSDEIIDYIDELSQITD